MTMRGRGVGVVVGSGRGVSLLERLGVVGVRGEGELVMVVTILKKGKGGGGERIDKIYQTIVLVSRFKAFKGGRGRTGPEVKT